MSVRNQEDLPEAVPKPIVRRPARRSPTTGHRKRSKELKRSQSSPREVIAPTSSDDDTQIVRRKSLSPDIIVEPKKVLRKRHKSKEPPQETKIDVQNEEMSVEKFIQNEISDKKEDTGEEIKDTPKEIKDEENKGKSWFSWLSWKNKFKDLNPEEENEEEYEIIETSEIMAETDKSDTDDLSSDFAKMVALVDTKKEPVDEKIPLKQIIFHCIRNSRSEFKKMEEEMPSEMDKLRKLRNKCACKLFIILILCGVGSVAFKFTEGAFESFYKCGVKRVKRDFINELWRESHFMREEEWKSKARRKLMDFENQLQDAFEAGMTTYSGKKSWSFINGIIYVLTVISTIGYGHIVPITTAGRALTIAYAIIGVPLFLTLLADFGKMFTRMIKLLWVYVRRLYYTGSLRKLPKIRMEDDAPGSPDVVSSTGFTIDDEFNLPVTIALVVFMAYLFIGAVIFFLWEDWTFFESFYFVFISMATIGFGDFVPENQIYMMFSIVYLVFGLALTSMCINVVQEKLSTTFAQASEKLGATIGIDLGDNVFNVEPTPLQTPSVPLSPKSSMKKGILQKGKNP